MSALYSNPQRENENENENENAPHSKNRWPVCLCFFPPTLPTGWLQRQTGSVHSQLLWVGSSTVCVIIGDNLQLVVSAEWVAAQTMRQDNGPCQENPALRTLPAQRAANRITDTCSTSIGSPDKAKKQPEGEDSTAARNLLGLYSRSRVYVLYADLTSSGQLNSMQSGMPCQSQLVQLDNFHSNDGYIQLQQNHIIDKQNTTHYIVSYLQGLSIIGSLWLSN